MSEPHVDNSEDNSVFVSESGKDSERSMFSNPKERLEKMVTILKNRVKNTGGEEEQEDVDYDEEIPDDDIRYILVADIAADMIREEQANRIRSGFENYQKLVVFSDVLRPILLTLMGIFIFFSRPEWCANQGSFINYACTMSLDPQNPREYYMTGLFLLSAETKVVICLLCMTAITMLNLAKIGVTVSNTTNKRSFYFCLVLMILYYFVYFYESFSFGQVPCVDILPVLFFIFNVPSLQKIMIKTLKIIVLSKEIITFNIIFLLMVATSARVLFHIIPEFYDTNESSYFIYNYENYQNSIYSSIVTVFLGANVFDLMLTLYQDYKLYMLYWLFVGFLLKFFVLNFLCGILYYYYNTLFDQEIEFVDEFPELKMKVKEDIYLGLINTDRLRMMVKMCYQTGNFDVNIVEIENFYKVTTLQRKVNWNNDNPDSLANVYLNLSKDIRYIFGIGLLEAVGVVLVLMSLEINSYHIYHLYVLLFIINAVLFLDYLTFLNSVRYESKYYTYVLDLVLGVIIGSYILIHLISSNNLYYQSLEADHPNFKKMIGLLFISKAFRFYKLFMYIPQIRVVVEVAFKSFAFITDIFGIILIFFFIFATIGIAVFGGGMSTESFVRFEEKYGDELDDQVTIMNFNDYPQAMITLFIIMLSDWLGQLPTNTLFVKDSMVNNFFFIIFFFFTNMCFLNILFGFMVDNVNAYLEAEVAKLEEEEAAAEEAEKERLEGGDNGDDDDNDGGSENNESQKAKSRLSDDLDFYIDFKRKNPQFENELQAINEEPEDTGPTFNKLNIKKKQNDEGDFDPLDDVFNKIRRK